MKTIKCFKKFLLQTFIGIFVLTNIIPVGLVSYASSDDVVFPLKEISKLECRFEEFAKLSSKCKMKIPRLRSKDYSKYIKQNGGYNDYTRLYTVLWGASYKYGWDVGHGGHIGTDIATARGTPVYAIADGEIKIAKTLLGLGKAISINHNIRGKFISSNYGHLSKILVKKGQKVKAGDKIGEVGSTGNSTGNHLHIQIDLDTTFHPYYYSRTKCNYSYYDITEKGICFNELQKNTIDPLVFFETKGKVLDDLKMSTKKISRPSTKLKKIVKAIKKDGIFSYSIFDRTVYVGYDYNDIVEVQSIFKDLGEYKGNINGNYNDLIKTIISYQISNNILKSKNDIGAGWFGPKTRKQARHDYENYLKNGGKKGQYKVVNKNNIDKDILFDSKIITNGIKVKKIDRKNILTREQIEKREVDDFLRNNTIELNFKDLGGNIENGKTKILKIFIKTKKGRGYRGNTPRGLTFSFDNSRIRVFPEKLYYFTDGKRDIKVSGLKEGLTVLKVNLGNKVIKTFKLNIFKAGKVVYPKSGQIIGVKNIVLGDSKTGLVLFKDINNKKLVNFNYGGKFTLKTNSGVKICVKKGSILNIKKIFKSSCLDKDFKDIYNFSYNDTVGGLLVFEYKAVSKSAKIELIDNYNKKIFSSKKIVVRNPSGLNKRYVYEKEVLEMLEKGIVGGLKRGYFLEKRELTKSEGNKWIINSLEEIKNETFDYDIKQLATKNINKLRKERLSKFDALSRKEFLEKSYTYLVFDKSPPDISIEYRDLKNIDNKKINSIFSKNDTWKDKFGSNYYRPEIKITRGEGAYLLSKVLKKNKSIYLSVK